MGGKEVLKKVADIKKQKEEKELMKKNAKLKQQDQLSAFLRCKCSCCCEESLCAAKGLRQCPKCHNILRSICSKAICKDENGNKPCMIKPFCDTKREKNLGKNVFSVSDGSEFDEDISMDYSADEESEDDCVDEDKETENVFRKGNYVKVILGAYKGYYAVVTSEGYGDEVEINYFEKKEKWWALKKHDLDSREKYELQLAKKVHIDHRSHYFFG